MHIGESRNEECLIIPLRLFYSLSILEFIFRVTLLIFTHKPWKDKSPESTPLLDLKFFTAFNTVEKQEQLRQAIEGVIKKIDIDTGSDWIVYYIAYCFYTENLKLTKNYAAFFHDIDLLLPGRLTKVDQNEETDSQRYKIYTQMLSYECSNWFILNGCLPKMSEWTLKQFTYHVSHDRQQLIQSLVIEVYKNLHS